MAINESVQSKVERALETVKRNLKLDVYEIEEMDYLSSLKVQVIKVKIKD